jgi:hypothetical protein
VPALQCYPWVLLRAHDRRGRGCQLSREPARAEGQKINAGMRPCHSPWRFTSRPESCPASEPPVPPPQGQCTVTKATGKPRRPTSSRSSRTPTATTPAAPSSCSPLASRALPGRIQSQGTIRLMTPLQAVAEPKLDLWDPSDGQMNSAGALSAHNG